MPTEFDSVFARLKEILVKHAGQLAVKTDTTDCYCLEAPVGPATIRAWGGKARKTAIPVAWVEIGKAYVSFHLMAAYGRKTIPAPLRPRMQGKTCFNFKTIDEPLFKELEQFTARGIAAFRKAGFIAAS
jgi:hypothetical protein